MQTQTTSIQLDGYTFLIGFDDDGIETVELELTAEQRLDFTAAHILAIERAAEHALALDPSPVYGWQEPKRGLLGELPAEAAAKEPPKPKKS